MERNLRRLKYNIFPKAPQSYEEIECQYLQDNIMKMFGYTLNDNPTIFYKGIFRDLENNYAFCVFGSDTIINLINTHIPLGQRNFLMDATFKVCPYGIFNQLLIIYVEYCNNVCKSFINSINFIKLTNVCFQSVPFLFILMSRKTEAYKGVFTYIENNVCSLKCRSFMTDYETAMRNALRAVYPETSLFACWFHFCQACKRQASKFEGFVTRLRQDKELQKIYAKFLAVPLIPSEDINQAFDMLCHEANAKDRQFFKRFINYFRRQWILKVIAL